MRASYVQDRGYKEIRSVIDYTAHTYSVQAHTSVRRRKAPDIPHRGPDFGEFLSVKPRILISQQLEEVLVLFGQIEYQGPLPQVGEQ